VIGVAGSFSVHASAPGSIPANTGASFTAVSTIACLGNSHLAVIAERTCISKQAKEARRPCRGARA
jgi:hypothetical protein